ncbi:MAG TPA: hypothetical protein VFM55_16595 [Micromonosporaceae bacterium]|nr:hypothetical protein [Micromonosporaceae bacterium]
MAAGAARDTESSASAEERLAELWTRVDVLAEAVRALITGFEGEPGIDIDEQRRSRATRLAAEILMAGEG